MGNLGFTEIMLILLVVLLLFGAKRLPEVGASIGKGIREFKRSLTDTQEAIMGSDEQRNDVSPAEPTRAADNQRPRASPSGCRSKQRWQRQSRQTSPPPRCGPVVV